MAAMVNASKGYALVSAASGGLGRAVLQRLLESAAYEQVVAVSRRTRPPELDRFGERLRWEVFDYSEPTLATLAARLASLKGQLRRICLCNGVLHGPDFGPEKRIEALAPETMHEVFQANTIVPMLFLQALLPLLPGDDGCVIAVFSARVGSIGDNRLGGWYSYRASKAALNMLLKTTAIEFARRAPNVKLIAFHPGTTDTHLSRPFQAAVPEDKLFSPDFVADKLLEIMAQANADGELSYLDWDNKSITW